MKLRIKTKCKQGVFEYWIQKKYWLGWFNFGNRIEYFGYHSKVIGPYYSLCSAEVAISDLYRTDHIDKEFKKKTKAMEYVPSFKKTSNVNLLGKHDVSETTSKTYKIITIYEQDQI